MSYDEEPLTRRELEEEREEVQQVPERQFQRYGGAQGEDDEDEDAKRKREDRERKKAEVRKRLEEAGRAKKAKKGFLTPERKKKLRQLLMKKAAEDLKQQQLLKEQERQKILGQRIIALPNVDGISAQGDLQKIFAEMIKHITKLEEEKYDLEYDVRQKDFEINEMNIQVNDLRGKFVKPALKKVSKYDTKFKKLQEKTEEKVDFRGTLKSVKKDITEVLTNVPAKSEKAPDWAKKVKGTLEAGGDTAAPEEWTSIHGVVCFFSSSLRKQLQQQQRIPVWFTYTNKYMQ